MLTTGIFFFSVSLSVSLLRHANVPVSDLGTQVLGSLVVSEGRFGPLFVPCLSWGPGGPSLGGTTVDTTTWRPEVLTFSHLKTIKFGGSNAPKHSCRAPLSILFQVSVWVVVLILCVGLRREGTEMSNSSANSYDELPTPNLFCYRGELSFTPSSTWISSPIPVRGRVRKS